MNAIHTILVPTDFSPASEAGLARAIELANELDATLTILHVYEAPVSFAYPGAPFVPVGDLSSTLRAGAQKDLDALVARTAVRVPRVTGILRQGSAWRNIDGVAREIGADLIVIGTHARTGLARALIGSVAEKMVRRATVPVLTVHAPTLPGEAAA